MMKIFVSLLLCTKFPTSEDAWKEALGLERYRIMREKQTEKPYSGKYTNDSQPGIYACYACKNPLFSSKDKLHLGTGWPLFSKPISKRSVYYLEDLTLRFKRYEVLCRKCDSHLGHVIKESPNTPLRYVINSIAILRRDP